MESCHAKWIKNTKEKEKTLPPLSPSSSPDPPLVPQPCQPSAAPVSSDQKPDKTAGQ